MMLMCFGRPMIYKIRYKGTDFSCKMWEVCFGYRKIKKYKFVHHAIEKPFDSLYNGFVRHGLLYKDLFFGMVMVSRAFIIKGKWALWNGNKG